MNCESRKTISCGASVTPPLYVRPRGVPKRPVSGGGVGDRQFWKAEVASIEAAYADPR